ncbi:MAG: hypothetical protein ACLTEE_16145 [Anaerobutyricum hallii]
MSELRAIRIERGPQGFGGPLIIRPTRRKIKLCILPVVELHRNV